MGQIVHIEDQFATTVEPRILEQYKDSSRWKACLKAVIDQMQVAEDASIELANILDFESDPPTGARLDWLAGLVNKKRLVGETDTAFFARFVSELGARTAGTPDNVIYNAALLSGDPQPLYMDEAPATFLVYDGPRFQVVSEGISTEEGEQITTEEGEPIGTEPTLTWGGGGRIQLSRAQVKKMAPAGVLGLPGAAIMLDNDIVFTTYDEDPAKRKLILAAAYDDTIEREVVLADNNGTVMMTAQSTPIRVTLQGSQVADIPVIETEWNGVPVDAVRIKDLPDAGYDSAYMVRDSSAGGTTKIDEDEVGLQMQPSGTNTLRFFKRT